MLAEEGKVMRRDREVVVLRERVELHCKGRVAVVEGVEVHCPAVSGEVEKAGVELKHWQDAHPGVSKAEEEQQHCPRHRLVAQSKLEAQVSPGEKVKQEPVAGAQRVHPMARAKALQQYPPKHPPLVQEELVVHKVPPGMLMVGVTEEEEEEQVPPEQGEYTSFLTREYSDTYTTPFPSTARYCGWYMRAFEPTPSVFPKGFEPK